MQIIASTQNEKLLNLATSASDRNTDRSSGMDFSYLFNLAKTSDSINASPVKQQNKATRTDRNTQSLYGENKKDLSVIKKENTVTFKQGNIARKSSSSETSSRYEKLDQDVLNKNKSDPFKNFNESDECKEIKEQAKIICEDEVNNDAITDQENNQAVQGQIINNYKLLETPNTYADVQAESRPITDEDIEALEALKNAENINPDEISDPNAESLTDIFLKSTLKIKEEDEVDEEQTDEETEEETANNIADNVKKLAIKDLSSSDKTLKTQIASMLAELNAESVEVVDKIDTAQSINDDEFGAKTFEAIEDSIIASMELEENSHNIEKEELLPEENEASEFKKSLDILKAAVKGSDSETDVSEESLASDEFVNPDENTANSRDAVKNTIVLRDQKNADSLKGSNGSSSKDSGSSLGGNQNQTSASAFIKEMNAKSATTQSTQSSFSTLLMSSNLKQNAQQITESVMKMAAKNLKSVNIQLSPEGMGKLKISIDMTKSDEVASVSISASNQATKQLVEQGLSDLKERLMANDIKADPKVEEYSEQEQSGHQQGQSEKNSEDHKKEHNLADNGENIEFVDDNLSFESLINSQNIDFMSKFA
ncbi:flagellar hook-length control protein FliK [Succinivibrio sp.]|uniref:flagellar hook-length control protein FliK n=2 Tax=Succinivibrio sp. TaxID=2053619 RepID=UPI00386B3841